MDAASFDGRSLDIPVLTLAGRYGVGARLADALRGRARDLSAEIVEDSGHFVAEEAPELFCARVERFLLA